MTDAVAEPSPTCRDVSPTGDDDAADLLALRRLASGDTAALDELIARHRDRVAGLAFRLAAWRSAEDIDDVVQEVFLAVLQHAKRFDSRSRVSTWLTAITLNRCRSIRHRLAVKARVLAAWVRGDGTTSAASDEAASASDEAARVRRAVSKLRPSDREVVVLHYLEETTVEEMTVILNLSRPAVEVRLHRARKRLRELLEET